MDLPAALVAAQAVKGIWVSKHPTQVGKLILAVPLWGKKVPYLFSQRGKGSRGQLCGLPETAGRKRLNLVALCSRLAPCGIWFATENKKVGASVKCARTSSVKTGHGVKFCPSNIRDPRKLLQIREGGNNEIVHIQGARDDAPDGGTRGVEMRTLVSSCWWKRCKDMFL